jgi:hypothetical protein
LARFELAEHCLEGDVAAMALLYPGGISWEELAKMKESGPLIGRRGLRMLTGRDGPPN